MAQPTARQAILNRALTGSSHSINSSASYLSPDHRINSPITFDGLSFPSIGARDRREDTEATRAARIETIAGAVRVILESIGEDPDREGLVKTPERYAKALMFFSKGYEESVNHHDEMVIVKNIDVFSLCEHHMVPFTGKIHIGYIPKNGKVVGLSKIARLAEMFSRRLQVQERLTKQVAMALQELLDPLGVAVVMEASHFCMVMRGVQKPGSQTITSSMFGCFRNHAKTREEFLSLIRN
ncbi:GTP cyclohydrolase 1 [Podila epigama]|nr:GTP cyclohydrolase 1 [Podila epigama]